MGHGHEAPLYKVPSADTYKVDDVPELVKLREKLAKKGLHDPWLRNHVWRYNPKFGTEFQRWMKMIFRGWKVGVAATVITIGIEKALDSGKGHDHHGEHGEGGHH